MSTDSVIKNLMDNIELSFQNKLNILKKQKLQSYKYIALDCYHCNMESRLNILSLNKRQIIPIDITLSCFYEAWWTCPHCQNHNIISEENKNTILLYNEFLFNKVNFYSSLIKE